MRCGLVITSTSCRVVWACAGHASARTPAATSAGRASEPRISCLLFVLSLQCLAQIGPQILGIFQTNVQPDRGRRHAEERQRVGGTLLHEAGGRRKCQALVAAPADAELEQGQRVTEPRDACLVAIGSTLSRPLAPERVATPGPESPNPSPSSG